MIIIGFSTYELMPNLIVFVDITSLLSVMQEYLQQKWQVNKAISNCTFHNTYVNEY